MSIGAATPLMTAEEFFEWANRPENANRLYELEAGRAVEVPSPGELHGFVCWLVIKLLTAYVGRRGAGYLCTNDTGLVVARGPDTVRGPDVMLYLESKRLDEMSRSFAQDIPALVVEVLSPSDRMSKTLRRVEQYHQRGVPLVWVVEPDARAIHVFRPNEFPRVLDESDDLTGNGVLPEFQHKVSDLFSTHGPP
jgi:Uma2 family endonuclease